MRPLKLTISAFGPYGNEVQIGMDQLGSRGLYLITGDTGAGKTTIFDAICFALYGEASGSNRRADMLRSNFAEPKTPTFVELEFSCGGKVYVVRRSPEYDRPKERGEGMTSQKAEACLIFPDGRQPLTRWKEVTAAITELIGLDREQFSQIAMIAQGDFLRLLLAKTEERSKIFREIFHTGRYQRFQDRVRQEASVLRTDYENLQRGLEQHAAGIQCDSARLEHITAEDGAAELLEQLLEEDEIARNGLLTEIQRQETVIQQLDGQLAQAELAEASRKELKEAENRLPELTQWLKARETEMAAHADIPQQVKTLQLQAESLRQTLPRYDRLTMMLENQTVLQKKIAEGKQQRQKLDEEDEKQRRTVEEIEQETSVLLEVTQKLAELETAGKEMKIRTEKLEQLQAAGTKLQLAQASLECGQKEYVLAREEADRLSKSYREMERLYLDHQAGILASSLEKGRPCPVCGSLDHPAPAIMGEQAPDQVALEHEKANLEKAMDRRDRASAEAHRLGGQTAAAEEQFSALALDVLGIADQQQVLTKLMQEQKTAKENLQRMRTDYTAEERRRKELGSRQEQLPRLRRDLEENTETCRKLDVELAAWTAEYTALQESVEQQKENLPCPNRQAAEEQIRACERQADDLERQQQMVQSAYVQAEQDLHKLKTRMQLLQQQISELAEVDLAQLQQQRAQLAEQRQNALKEKEQLAHRLTANRAILSQLQSGMEKLKQIGQQWTMVRNLSETVNGALSGKEKVMLETYVQMTFFDRVLRRANVRLLEMTGGRYSLQRRVAAGHRSQSGLDLDVVDHGTGVARSAASLSGGESFQASLSLALGMSDELQPVGGVRLESLFVDEGFGSLDEEALRQAMQTLQGLSEGDRLVGIISHVELLKQWVDRQIRVERQLDGQSCVRICLDR